MFTESLSQIFEAVLFFVRTLTEQGWSGPQDSIVCIQRRFSLLLDDADSCIMDLLWSLLTDMLG